MVGDDDMYCAKEGICKVTALMNDEAHKRDVAALDTHFWLPGFMTTTGAC